MLVYLIRVTRSDAHRRASSTMVCREDGRLAVFPELADAEAERDLLLPACQERGWVLDILPMERGN